MALMGPAVSRTNPWVAWSVETSRWREPTSPLSSPTVQTNSMVGCGDPGFSCNRVSTSRQPAIPDLSSAPRMVDPSVRMTPVVADDGHDATVRASGVHVSRHKDRSRTRAGQDSDEVADVVAAGRAAQPAEPLLERPPHHLLGTGGAVNRHEVEKRTKQPILVDLHRCHPSTLRRPGELPRLATAPTARSDVMAQPRSPPHPARVRSPLSK